MHYSVQSQTAFVTAFTDHPRFHVFIGPTEAWLAPSDINLKIPYAAALEDKVFFADCTNLLSWADMRLRTILPISDPWRKRARKDLKKAGEIISMDVTKTQPTLLLCLCRKGRELWLLQTPVGERDEGYALRDTNYFLDVITR